MLRRIRQRLMVSPKGSKDPVMLCGYYGEHNLGDDALLAVLLCQLPEGCRPLITAYDQSAVACAFTAETVDRRNPAAVFAALGRCRALVLGGGSLLQDSTSFASLLYYVLLILAARSQNKPVLLWAQGLGPLRRRRSRGLVRFVLARISGASWRDEESARLAQQLGCRYDLVGSDPVWGLDSGAWQGPGGPIVLCWRPVATLSPPEWSLYLRAVATLAERLDRRVVWLPFHREQDSGLLGALHEQGLVPAGLLARSSSMRPDTPAEAIELLSSAALVVAMRLHGLILAALAGAPVVALSYDPKVAAAAAAIGCDCRHLGANHPAADSLDTVLSAWSASVEQPTDARRLLELRHQAEVHRTVLRGLMPEASFKP
ncbi:MAG: polysaccharide pyruvyl transferase CsaB [Synechococcaceae cyanobacterium]|nr:polysaccharide pyruvyl transferase CsaB [Synechococcaceae cyanobacterium]